MSPTAERIVVAMSGGVDSTVAAALLRNAGHDLVGVTLKLQQCESAQTSRSCCGVDGIVRAREAAGHLGIPHYVVDCIEEFGKRVLEPAWDAYAHGRTPSPCLLCNEHIKFGQLLEWARQLGVSRVATGHYARVMYDDAGEPSLLRGVDQNKDQSYFLAGLTAAQLRSVIFPVGHLAKPEVREMARAMQVTNAETHDSQDACLVGPDQTYAEMLRERFSGESRAGLIVNGEGRVLGHHQGIHNYTVGQRRGLAIHATSRTWVKSVDSETATVVVTHDERELLRDRLVAIGLNWLGKDSLTAPLRCQVQVRYRHAAEPAVLERSGTDAVQIVFDKPVRAIAPGQAAVFYDGDRVLGRGWIQTSGGATQGLPTASEADGANTAAQR